MPKKIITPEYSIHYPVKIAKSKIAGKGAYALQRIPAKKKDWRSRRYYYYDEGSNAIDKRFESY